MNWEEEYKRKLVTAEEAVKAVKPGEKVGFGFPRQPTSLTAALAARREELDNVEILMENPRVDDGWLEPGKNEAFKVTMEVFIGPTMRKWTDNKKADYLPIVFSVEPKPYRERTSSEVKKLDVYLVVVSPPDKNGFCSFGPNLWNKRMLCGTAGTVIAEVDDTLIRTYGENYIHVSEIDYFVRYTPPITISEGEFNEIISSHAPERQQKLREIFQYFTTVQRSEHLSYLLGADDRTLDLYYDIFGIGEPGPRDKAIAENVKQLIKDGDTIQVGVAGIPARLPRLGTFDNKVDLGYHGEMAARGIGRLIQGGIITGKRKSIHKGKAVFTSLEGFSSAELEFASENPLIELYDADYVVNIKTISSNENMLAMNHALGVDLTGQITCETVFGGRMVNGTGGQPESHIGAVLSKGGRAITYLYSTAVNDTVSTIVPQFEQGEIVSIPRYFADYIVTEYGVARLLGKSVKQRAEELISIAHPDFRAELGKAAQKLF